MGRTSDAREKLVEVASNLMWKRGYIDVGVNELCKKAGVKPGSFYYFFPSKAELAIEALEANWQRARRKVLDPAARAENPLDRLSLFVELIERVQAETQEQEGCVYGCPFANLAGELDAIDDSIRVKLDEIFTRYYAYFEDILQDAQDQGLAQIDDIPRKARSLFALVEGIQVLAQTHNDASLITQLTPDVRALIAA